MENVEFEQFAKFISREVALLHDVSEQEVFATPEAALGLDLKVDSLEMIELTVLVEEEYEVDLSDSALTEQQRLSDLWAIVIDHRK